MYSIQVYYHARMAGEGMKLLCEMDLSGIDRLRSNEAHISAVGIMMTVGCQREEQLSVWMKEGKGKKRSKRMERTRAIFTRGRLVHFKYSLPSISSYLRKTQSSSFLHLHNFCSYLLGSER